MQSKIIVIDDEKDIRNLIGIYLENEGLIIEKFEDAIGALHYLETNDADLIILDIMLPRMDGIQACLKIREERTMPIIMLSAKTEDMDKIQGLMAGADDYLAKPFNPLELVARVKAQLRRTNKYASKLNQREKVIQIGDLQIDTETRQVKVANQLIRLTPKEFDILLLLAQNKGIVMSSEQIYETIWKEPFFRGTNNVMVHITKVREKIEKDPKSPVYIKTVWGVGYTI